MKILHIIPTYLPSVHSRGAIDSMHFLNKQLVQGGVDVSVYTTNQDGAGGVMDVPTGSEVKIDGVRVIYCKSTFLRRWYYSGDMRKLLLKTVADFDVIHITSVFLAQSFLGSYYARKFNKPYVITPHGSLMKTPLSMHAWLKKIYIQFIERINIKHAVMHFTTEIEQKEFVEARLVSKGMFVAPNAFEPETIVGNIERGMFRKKFGIPLDAPVVLFLGRLARIKGFDTLIPAFAEVVKKLPRAVLVLAGPDDGGYLSEINSLISEYGIEKSIVFTGMIVGKEKRSAYFDSDVFVAPSYSENFGMAIVEAMHYGVPVVITEGVGLAPLIAREGAGIVVKKELFELSGAILSLLENVSFRGRVGVLSKKLVDNEFSPKSVTDRFMREYNRARG